LPPVCAYFWDRKPLESFVPELPEVETVRRIFDRVLTGKKIIHAEIAPDEIVLKGMDSKLVHQAIEGRTVTGTGRKGKYFWLELDEKPWLFGHLGMAGWVREIGASTIRLKEHGNAPFEDAEGKTRFLKMGLVAEDGKRVVMTDGRRLARIWLCEAPQVDLAISKLGPDCYNELPTGAEILDKIRKRSAPMKALLLDQSLFCGVGNWIADEVLYHSGIKPARLGKEMSLEDAGRLRDALDRVIRHSVDVGADSDAFPKNWLFHYRWGGSKGDDMIEGQEIIREQIGGRTTAWVPSRQS
jgi:formamidopyrimidine-DNA glycosylase